jgi:hypothetical protein
MTPPDWMFGTLGTMKMKIGLGNRLVGCTMTIQRMKRRRMT